MSRALTVGNGTILVGLDFCSQVRDFYYPFVGQTNHVSGASGNFLHRIGVFVDDELAWFDDSEWAIELTYRDNSMVGELLAIHERLQVSITGSIGVHNESNVFIRSFHITNTAATTRVIKIFFSQQFRLAESRRGDTAMYDPRVKAIIHYKGKDTFLINAQCNGVQFTEYNIGLFGIEGKEGTYYDAHDGVLEKNPVEHGSVDSVIGCSKELAAGATTDIWYWIACGDSVPAVHVLDAMVQEETPERLLRSTDSYWQAWLEKSLPIVEKLPSTLQKLYTTSLGIIRVHTDNRGGIIASSDTDMLHHGRDTYSYVWPRDGALIAYTLDLVGYSEVAERFYDFMSKCIEPQGYLMHKYLTDGSLGSSWHAWMRDGQPILPIQVDETATMVFALWTHYEVERDLEFIEGQYNAFIEPAANFLTEYIESTTGLPMSSFDLWEEKFGSSTYTAASVYGGLKAAARFANLLGKDNDARTYDAVAQRLRSAICTYLFDDERQFFIKHIHVREDGEYEYDTTCDVSSFFGVVFFGVLEPDDERVQKAVAVTEKRLAVQSSSQGYVRYENDSYYRMQDASSPNPWVITTLWMAQYYILRATTKKDLAAVLEVLEWTASHASSTGTLSEQMHPHTREHLSTSPLIWSHAEYVKTAYLYTEKLKELTK